MMKKKYKEEGSDFASKNFFEKKIVKAGLVLVLILELSLFQIVWPFSAGLAHAEAANESLSQPESENMHEETTTSKGAAENTEKTENIEKDDSPSITPKSEDAKKDAENPPAAKEEPESLWKTCGLSELFEKIEDKKNSDVCKEKATCGKIETCLKAKIDVAADADIQNDAETVADTGQNNVEIEDQEVRGLAERTAARENEPSPADAASGAIIPPESEAPVPETPPSVDLSAPSPLAQPAISENGKADEISAPETSEDMPKTDRSQRSGERYDVQKPGEPAGDEADQKDISAEITTGDATAVSAVVNEVNTNIIGENGMATVENVYGDYAGDINLLDSFNSILENAKKTNDGNESALGTMDIAVENEADVKNDILTSADTGKNEIANESDSGDSTIASGEALAVTDVANIVNTNIIGNNFLFSVINIFGKWTGDLIVPGEGLLAAPEGSQAPGLVVDVQNETNIKNDIETSAATGENELKNKNGAAIMQTGDANSESIVVNETGTTIVGNNWFFLAVNNLGNWVGNVLNWNEDKNGYEDVFSFDFDEKDDQDGRGLAGWMTKIFIKNEANIENNIATTANSGGNEIRSEGGAASVKTGNAYAFSKVYNFVNNNFIGCNWMFAVVNIFGEWQGNVNFVKPETPQPTDDGNETWPTENPGETVVHSQTTGTSEPQEIADGATGNKDPKSGLALTRKESDKKIKVGSIQKHTLILENTGESAIHDIVISDGITNKKGGAGDFSWNVPKLDPGKKAVVEYKLMISSGAPTGSYRNNASAWGYDEADRKVESNEAGAITAVEKANEAVANANLDYYTYYTYDYIWKAVPVDSSLTISPAAEAASEADGKVLGRSLKPWNKPTDSNRFNPAWVALAALFMLFLRRKSKKTKVA